MILKDDPANKLSHSQVLSSTATHDCGSAVTLRQEQTMKRILLTAASLALATGVGTVGALAAHIPQPAAGTVDYGPVPAAPLASMAAPTAPAGFHYAWVYGYDHHAVYKAHWEAIRN
jgi:O-antigen/teichoic acid export membrane protein